MEFKEVPKHLRDELRDAIREIEQYAKLVTAGIKQYVAAAKKE